MYVYICMSYLEVCSGFIAEALDQGGAILVHCQACVERER